MRVPETIIRKGFFWKAGHEDHQVSGTLKIEDGGESELEIIGNLTANTGIDHIFSSELESNFLIYGKIDKDNYTTLYNCHYKKRTHSLTSGIITSTIKSRKTLLGVASDEEAPKITYKSVYFELEDISPWIDISGFKLVLPHNQKRFLIDFTLPEEIEANLHGIGSFKIEFNANYPANFKTEVTTRQTTAFKIYPKSPIKIEDSIEIIGKIQHFLMLATQHTLTLKNTKAILFTGEEYSDQEVPRTIVQWYYESSPFQEASKQKSKEDALFTISEITSTLESRLNIWLQIYEKCQTPIRLYFSAITGDHKYSESLYLSLSQSAESYQRITSGNKNLTFKQRLNELTTPFIHLCKFNIDLFLETATFTRNYFTHYNEEIKDKAATGLDLYILNKRLKDLITLSLLRDVGFTDEEIENISKKSKLLHDNEN